VNGEPLAVCGWAWLAWALVWAAAAARTEKTERAEPRLLRLEHSLATGAALALLFWPSAGLGALSRPWLRASWARWGGAAVAVAGLLFAAWARRHLGRFWSGAITLKRGHRLIVSGPYALARHPIYTGFLSAIGGTAAAGGRVQGLLAFVLAVAVYRRKLRREEALMLERFGAEYEDYRRRVPPLVPRLRR
jgi:protein-S-isoprenylcysteine O-methyltransferase Ste14